MNNFKFITKQDMTKELFFKMPKSLMYELKYKKLSANAKLLYSMLLDRTSLSIENNWFDEHDRAYIICEIDEIEIFLNCARATAVKSMKELEKYNLLMKLKRGQGLANLLYVAHVDTSKDTLDTHLKFHKRMINALKDRREQQKLMYLSKKFKNCTSIENTNVEEVKKVQPLEILKSSKIKFNEIQNLDGNNTNNKETEDVVIERTPSPKVSLVKEFGFDVNDKQIKLIDGMDFDLLKDAVETTVAKGGKVFAYVYEVYKSLRDKVSTKTTKAVKYNKNKSSVSSKTKEDLNNTINRIRSKNKFRNFNETFDKYEEDEFEAILRKSQEAKYGTAVL
ncbi:replication initiator protein A [Romboutsia sp. 1001216sp1]|uniref:replication initiator protein A n=1 Tax=Romboutsia sp. 1001216sp1 TaxID=2986997 RepID=UPI00232E4D9C|nr:replication initiator protein A [Romboutsia sp. 1001216sp1]MDB8791711.1 replication initiator protein A [Romboutsia sp. 1001216sp1]